MALFRKKQPVVATPEKPADFGFFDDDEWVAFNVGVLEAVRTLNLDVERLDPGVVILRGRDTFGLLNIAQRCHGTPRSEWNALITEHLRVSSALAKPSDDTYDAANLRLRLVPDEYFGFLAEAEDELIGRPFAKDVLAVPAFDAPESIVMATASIIADIGLSADEAFERAWSQTREFERVNNVEVIEIGGVNFHGVLDGNFFTASLVRYLPDLIGDVGPNGALVAIPRRGDVIAYPFQDDSAMSAVKSLLGVTRQIYVNGPGSVSPHVYWWRDGELEWLPSFATDEKITLKPPIEFVEMLGQLPPAR